MRKGERRRSLSAIYGKSFKENSHKLLTILFIIYYVLIVCVNLPVVTMLIKKDYTRRELENIFKTTRIDVIKNKLTRQGYKFETSGRGQDLMLTITELPQRFKSFCIEKLNFEPQTDFYKLKAFFRIALFDDRFIQLPFSEMERQLCDEIGVSRQTISKWLKHLEKQGLIDIGKNIYNYFLIEKIDGVNKAKEIPREEYAAAWKSYWKNKDKYGAEMAFRLVQADANGVPYKKGQVGYNAFRLDILTELLEIIIEEEDIK